MPPGWMRFARGGLGNRTDPGRDARARSIRWFGVVPKCDLAIRHHVVLPFFQAEFNSCGQHAARSGRLALRHVRRGFSVAMQTAPMYAGAANAAVSLPAPAPARVSAWGLGWASKPAATRDAAP